MSSSISIPDHPPTPAASSTFGPNLTKTLLFGVVDSIFRRQADRRAVRGVISKASSTAISLLVVQLLFSNTIWDQVGGLGDWFKTWLRSSFYPTAYISSSDPARRHIQLWLASDPFVQGQLGTFVLKTAPAGEGGTLGPAPLPIYQRGRLVAMDKVSARRRMRNNENLLDTKLLPKQTVAIKFEGKKIWISNVSSQTKMMKLSVITFDKTVLKRFVEEAYRRFHVKDPDEVMVFNAGTSKHTIIDESGSRVSSHWQAPIRKAARPWPSILLPHKDSILEDMRQFFSDEEREWYSERGIPHRKGYLFHGPPGGGKTTLVTGLASSLHCLLYNISVSADGMSDDILAALLRSCGPCSLILIEDIDRIFLSKNASSTQDIIHKIVEGSDKTEKETLNLRNTVTMSGLLNAIDGVTAQEGCILIASTNHIDRIDPALCRAGRFDVRVPFGYATPEQARSLFLHFYRIDSRDPHLTQAVLEELADRLAVNLHAGGERENVQSTTSPAPPGVSMAALQAFLLGYKKDPAAAVGKVSAWKMSGDRYAVVTPTSRASAPYAEEEVGETEVVKKKAKKSKTGSKTKTTETKEFEPIGRKSSVIDAPATVRESKACDVGAPAQENHGSSAVGGKDADSGNSGQSGFEPTPTPTEVDTPMVQSDSSNLSSTLTAAGRLSDVTLVPDDDGVVIDTTKTAMMRETKVDKAVETFGG